MEGLSDAQPRPKIWRLHLLWFSRYLNSKFWSRDYHVIMTSQNFVVMGRNVRDLYTFHMLGYNRLWLLWFSQYSRSKFWSRDYDVIGRGQNFLTPLVHGPHGYLQPPKVSSSYLFWFRRRVRHQNVPHLYMYV